MDIKIRFGDHFTMFIAISIDITVTHLVIVGVRANTVDKCDNTFGDEDVIAAVKHSVFTKVKAEIKMSMPLCYYQGNH